MEYEKLTIGNTIKKLRIKKNVSVVELAFKTNISESHVYQVENGAQKMSIDLLFRLIETLETDANTILGVKPKTDLIDSELRKLEPEQQKTLIPLFKTLIEQVKNQH